MVANPYKSKLCPDCREYSAHTDLYCRRCGTRLLDVTTPRASSTKTDVHLYLGASKLCPDCKEYNARSDIHCRRCGAKLPESASRGPDEAGEKRGLGNILYELYQREITEGTSGCLKYLLSDTIFGWIDFFRGG